MQNQLKKVKKIQALQSVMAAILIDGSLVCFGRAEHAEPEQLSILYVPGSKSGFGD